MFRHREISCDIEIRSYEVYVQINHVKNPKAVRALISPHTVLKPNSEVKFTVKGYENWTLTPNETQRTK